jgi:hypothetical protein
MKKEAWHEKVFGTINILSKFSLFLFLYHKNNFKGRNKTFSFQFIQKNNLKQKNVMYRYESSINHFYDSKQNIFNAKNIFQGFKRYEQRQGLRCVCE